MKPALFLDRDGVVNGEVDYLHKIEDVRWVPGIFDLCRAAIAKGYAPVIVTNQAGIGRGLYTEADFSALMDWMRTTFKAEGCPLAGVYHCPHHPTKGQGGYLRDCDCRKPLPGMFLQAAKDLDLDCAKSLMVGDKRADLQAAQAAGVPTRVFYPGKETETPPEATRAVADLAEIIPLLDPLGA